MLLNKNIDIQWIEQMYFQSQKKMYKKNIL